MSAVAEVQTVTITVDDVELQVPKGELVIESVKRLGIEIPIFCYHPRMKPVGMCRICLVEVATKAPDGSLRKMPKPQTACSLPATEGLVITTESEAIHRDRKSVLEFLLINHPLDCPICDRGGECPLQNNTLFYGPSTSRFVEMKRHAPKAFPLSQYVTMDFERCIQCGRCVRFTEEISGDAQLAFRFRGASMQPSTFQLTDFESKFSGNTIEICPVGALTSSKYRFRARPWDLQTAAGICTLCSNGCNIYVDYRRQEIARVNGRTNEEVNEEWTCDRGKFGHHRFNAEDRLERALVRRGDALVATEHADAYGEILGAFTSGSTAALAAQDLSNEDLYFLKRLFTDHFSGEVDCRFEPFPPTQDGPQAEPLLSIAEYEARPKILVFGTDLSDEEPILYLRVRKAWYRHAAEIVTAHHEITDLDSCAHQILRYAPGTEDVLARALAGEVEPDEAARVTGVPVDVIAEVREWARDAAVVTTRGIYASPVGARTVAALRNLGGPVSVYARGANEEGAALLGYHDGATAHQLLTRAANGELQALWLAGVDPLEVHPDRSLVERALENVPFLVVQHWRQVEAVNYASVVLPMAAPAERDGTYTNLERRIQEMKRVLTPRGDAKAVWRACLDLSLRLRPERPYFHAYEVLEEIRRVVPAFPPAETPDVKTAGNTGQRPVELVAA